jgi:hypothetical protein
MPPCPSRARGLELALASKRSTNPVILQLEEWTDWCRRLVEHKPLSKAVGLGATDTLKIILTTQDGKTARRPHQAFLLLRDADTGLDISYPFNVKDNGKAKVDLVGVVGQCIVRL